MIEKLNKHKHLVTLFVSVLLLISLNLNSFAVETKYIDFNNCDYSAFYNPTSGGSKDITSTTVRKSEHITSQGLDLMGSTFTFPVTYKNLRKGIVLNPILNLYTGNRYNFDMYLCVGSSAGTCSVLIQLWFSNSNDEVVNAVTIYDNENVSTAFFQKISGEFTTPDTSGATKCFMMFIIASEYSTNSFTLSNMNIKNVDPIATGKPIVTPSEDDLKNAIDNYDSIIDSFPKIDGEELDNSFNFDFQPFVGGMQAVRTLFNRVMSVLGFNAVLLFSLSIGLATFIIGRKLGD